MNPNYTESGKKELPAPQEVRINPNISESYKESPLKQIETRVNPNYKESMNEPLPKPSKRMINNNLRESHDFKNRDDFKPKSSKGGRVNPNFGQSELFSNNDGYNAFKDD